ncbi:hypothetical protein ACVWZR_001091 [Bradyrhizobium sp. i1.3.1]
MMPAHETYDVIVVGAGAGGMTAAAVAAAEGLRVLVIEKTAFVGGTTAWSDGMVWIPANPKMKDVGLSDSITDAVRYLSSTVPEPANAGLRAAFLARGPEAVAYLEANTEVRLQPVKACPDCYPERLGATSGGRVLEPVAFDGTRLGAPFARLRAPLPELTLFGGMMVNRLDIPHLRRAGKSLRSTLRAARLVSEYALQRLRNRRGTTLHLGNALAARLYASLLARQVEILFCADVEDLSMQGDHVGGVVIRHGSRDRLISARRGVVVATGGFSHDAVLRKTLLPGRGWFRLGGQHRWHWRRAPACGHGRCRAQHGGDESGLLGAGLAVPSRRWQPWRFSAYGDRPRQARRDRHQRGRPSLRQRGAVAP